MGKSSGAPAAPDPYATANAQSTYDKATAQFNAGLNRYDTYTPFGSEQWQITGTDPATGAPTYNHLLNLSPTAQTALTNTLQTKSGLSTLQQQALGGVANELNSNPFDRSQLPARPINAGQTAQDAIMERLAPQIDLENKQFEADMANRGIAQGSEPYLNAKRGLSNTQNDRELQAAATGINVGNDSRNQAIQEQAYYANAPLNFLTGLMSGSQVQSPQFQGASTLTANAPNFQQAQANNYQGRLNSYNSQVASDNANTQAASSLAASYLMYLALA